MNIDYKCIDLLTDIEKNIGPISYILRLHSGEAY